MVKLSLETSAGSTPMAIDQNNYSLTLKLEFRQRELVWLSLCVRAQRCQTDFVRHCTARGYKLLVQSVYCVLCQNIR